MENSSIKFVKRIIEAFSEVDTFKEFLKRFDYLINNSLDGYHYEIFVDETLLITGKLNYKNKIIGLSKEQILNEATNVFKTDNRRILKITDEVVFFLLKNKQGIFGLIRVKKNVGSLSVDEKDRFEIMANVISTALQNLSIEDVSGKEVNYELMVEKSADIIYSCDFEGNFTYINPVGLKLSGFKIEEIIGTSFLLFIHPTFRDKAKEFYHKQFSGLITNTYFEYPIFKKNGQILWLGQNVQLITKKGRIIRFHAVARDISVSKKKVTL